MATRIEFYERRREHIPDPAARLIAEEMLTENQLPTRDEITAQFHEVELSIERLRSSMFRWQLAFFVPLWIGVYGTLVAILVRGA